MRILVTGKDGQVGRAFQKEFDCLFGSHNLPVQVYYIGRQECNLSDLSALEKLLNDFQPNLIINTAAYTAVDKAEQEPDLAFTINALVPEVLAKYAVTHNASLMHYSTDYVFDGEGSDFYLEDRPVHPLGIYGKSKAEGERLIIDAFSKSNNANARYAIFRTSWVYGEGGNFIRTILRLAKDRGEIKVIANQFGVPTSAQWLATLSSFFLLDLSRARDISLRDFQSGIYHVVPSGETSWHGLACEAVRVANEAGASLMLAVEGVKPIPAVEYPLPAPRPMNSRLSTVKLATELERLELMSKLADSNNVLSQPWSEPVCTYVKQLVAQGDL